MNYREQQRINRNKTNIVLSIYLAIFVFIGFLGEVLLFNIKYNSGDLNLIEFAPVLFDAILNGTHVPYVFISMTVIAVVVIFITLRFGSKIMLSGSEYIEVTEGQLFNIVEELVVRAKIKMPKVYIMSNSAMNAFATGVDSDNGIVAITSGLMDGLTRSEIAAVMAHEIAHIKNEDIRLTMVVGILTNIMVWAVDIIFHFFQKSDSKAVQQASMILLILKFVLPILTIILQMYISRKREFLADAGSAEYTSDPEALISALQKISGNYKVEDNKTREYAYIFSDGLFSTHPKMENRIKALRAF